MAGYAVYGAVYIWQTSVVVGGERYFLLLDDAMISMRYAHNLVRGHGLVYNPGGEPVEGYTNLAWVLYMALLHLLPLAVSKLSVLIQVSGGVLLMANLYVTARLADEACDYQTPVTIGAVLLTALYLPLNTWALQGMEVSLLALVVTLSAVLLVRVRRRQTDLRWPLLLLAGSTLVRMDMVVPTLAAMAFLVWDQRDRRSEVLLWGFGLLVLFLGAQTVFRVAYYGDWLPNTYYLKMTGYPVGQRIERGAQVLVAMVGQAWVIPFLLPLAWLLYERSRVNLLLLWLFASQCAYSVYVGGDVWEWYGGANRFVSLAMPVFMISISYALWRFLGRTGGRRRRLWFGVAMAVLVLAFNSRGDLSGISRVGLLEPPLHRVDNENMVRRAQLIERLTEPKASIAVTWAGIVPYLTDRPVVDLLGKNDRVIARGPAARDMRTGQLAEFLPGHTKWDYSYSLGKLKPDVVVQGWPAAGSGEPWLSSEYHRVPVERFLLHFRRNSPHVKWEYFRPAEGSQGSLPSEAAVSAAGLSMGSNRRVGF
jgi:hypothetical protein